MLSTYVSDQHGNTSSRPVRLNQHFIQVCLSAYAYYRKTLLFPFNEQDIERILGFQVVSPTANNVNGALHYK